MPPTDTRKLVGRLIPGGLDAFLREARSDGLTFAQITHRLRDVHDIDVTQETVRRWTLESERTAS